MRTDHTESARALLAEAERLAMNQGALERLADFLRNVYNDPNHYGVWARQFQTSSEAPRFGPPFL